MASAEQQVIQNQMAQRDMNNAMNVRNELSQQQVGHERQTQELRDYLETGQRRQVQEVESQAEQRLMAERQKNNEELRNVRQSFVTQQTSVPMEIQVLDEPKKAIKHTATPTSTPPVKSKAKTMPAGLNSALSLPPPEQLASSSSSKQLTDGTARNRSTSRKGTRKETNEPEEGHSKQRTVSADPSKARRERIIQSGAPNGTLTPDKIGITKLNNESKEAKNKGMLSKEDLSEYLKLYDSYYNAVKSKVLDATQKQQLKDKSLQGLKTLYSKSLYKPTLETK